MRALTGLLVLFLGQLLIAEDTRAQSATSAEYKVKAVFLYNFTQFIEWPNEAFETEHAPLIIGILGADPFGDYLDQTIKNEKIDGHPLVVRRYKQLEEIDNCHILYVSTEDKNQLKKISEFASARHILTVSDAITFARQGGMVRFFPDQNKVRIRINLTSVKAADLTVNSKLLRLAEVVE